MLEPEWYEKMHKMTLEHKSSDGWYPVGLLEWTDEYKEYSEAGTPGDDWIWVKQEYRGPIKYYWYSIGGNPEYGNTLYSLRPWGIIEILQYLVCSPVVAIGRPTDKGTPVMGIPKGVRLKGMTEYIMREDKIKDNETR